MTIEEIKEKWGAGDGYISCLDCPLNSIKCDPAFASGYQECWAEIAKHYSNEPVTDEQNPYEGNPYWERISELAERQRSKGLSKYGYGLENNPAAIVERINHLEEELIDGLMYCEWIKEHFNG